MKRFILVVSGMLFCAVSVAHAQVDSSGVLDQALSMYRSTAARWESVAMGAATGLFWSLATISLVWTMGQLALRRAEIGEVFGEVVRFLLFTGFWAWMLANGPTHARMIIDSMVQLAGSASGQGVSSMSPSGVLDVGFRVLDQALEHSSISSPFDSAVGILLSLVIVVVLALVGVNLLVTQIASWIVAYAGIIVLGFGGSRWTSDMAMNYYRTMLSLGLQMLALVLLVGMGEGFLRSYYGALGKDISIHEQAVLLVVSIVLLSTVNRVPGLLGSLANGPGAHHVLGAGGGAALSTLSTAGAMYAMAKGRAAEGVEQIAKATGASATSNPATTSALVDGFRSRSNESGSTSGSVFAAPESKLQDNFSPRSQGETVRPEGLAASSEAMSAASAEYRGRERSAEATELPLNAADENGNTPSNSDVAEEFEPDAKAGQGDHAAEQTSSGTSDTESGAENGPGAGHAGSASDSIIERDGGADRGARQNEGSTSAPSASTGAAAAALTSFGGSAPGAVRTSDAASTTTVGSSTASVTSTPTTPTSIPHGAFSGSASASSARPTVAAPNAALAGATGSIMAAPRDLPFAHTAASIEPPKTHASTVATATIERVELPLAYSEQLAVDVEAEISAFRDKE